MTNPAALTDEELASLETRAWLVLRSVGPENTCGPGGMECGYDLGEECQWHEPTQVVEQVPRLIAALRAKDEELRNVQAEMAGLVKLAQSNRVEADAMGEIAREWEAQVERLRDAALRSGTKSTLA